MKIFLTLVLLLSISTVLSVEPDYYWKDYDGQVPSDAFEAGRDKYGKPIYIGQAFWAEGLLPGTLHAGSTNLKATAFGRRLNTNRFVKILCTQHPHKFHWARVNSYSNVSALTNVHFVEGGTESNAPVYIGRVKHEGDLEVGKVNNVGAFKGLSLPNCSGVSTAFYMRFEILIYLNKIDVTITYRYFDGISFVYL